MGGYMSPEEAERRSPYYQDPSVNNPQYHNEGTSYTTSVSRWNQQSGAWEYDAEATRQAQEEERQQQASRQGYDYQSAQRQAYDPVQQYRNQQAGYGAAQAQKDYFDRADIYTPDDPAQLNLMKQGYTAGQAAEMLRYDAQQRGDYKAERKYETLRLQAWTTATGESSAYHTAAKESGLPQDPNPYEYGADLFTYAEKGYPQRPADRFSPVDYSVLNLPEGKGGQAYIWQPDQNRNYDLRGAMDVVASAQRSGQMGAYGGLSASSSTYGKLSIGEQQAIGRYVNENPEQQRRGFITNDAAMSQFTPEVMGKNRGAFVSSVSPTIAPGGKSKYLTTEELFAAGFTESTVYRPSDASMAARNMYGGEKDANPVNAALITMWDFATPGTDITTKTGKTQVVDRSRLDPSGGAMWRAKFIDPATNKPTDILKTAEGAPYLGKDGLMYQDYRIDDLSKVAVTPVMVTTSPGKSGYDVLQEKGSNFVYDKIGGAMGISGAQAKKAVSLSDLFARETANYSPTPTNLARAMGTGMVKDTLDKPVEGVAVFALSYAGGAVFRGVESVGIAAAPSVVKLSPTLAKVGSVGWKALPYALTSVYAGTTSYRVTEGFTDFKPGNVSSRVGGVLATETVPMTAGFYGGYNLPESFAYAKTLPGRFSEYNYDRQLNRYNIQRIPPGSGGSRGFIDVEGTPVYEVPYRSRYGINNEDAYMAWGGGRRATATRSGTKEEPFYLRDYTPTQRQTYDPSAVRYTPQALMVKQKPTTIDLRPVVDLQTGKYMYSRPSNVATLAEQRMIMTQYELSPAEIQFATRTRASLNDILAMRAEQTPVSQSLSLIGSNLVQRMYLSQTTGRDSLSLSRQTGMLETGARTQSLWGTQALVGSNLAQRMYPATSKQSVYAGRTTPRSAREPVLIPVSLTIPSGATRTVTRQTPTTTPVYRTITTPDSRQRTDPIITTVPTWRSPPTAQTWWRYDGGGGGGRGRIPPIPPIIPGIGWGGSSSQAGSLRVRRGRPLTQTLTVNFGRVTSPMFGGILPRTASRTSTARRAPAKKAKRRRK